MLVIKSTAPEKFKHALVNFYQVTSVLALPSTPAFLDQAIFNSACATDTTLHAYGTNFYDYPVLHCQSSGKPSNFKATAVLVKTPDSKL